MQPRSLLLLLLLPSFALAQEDAGYLPPKAKSPAHHANERWNGAIGLSGGSMNFHQNGNMGLAFNVGYNLIQGDRSSLSLSQGITIGSADEYGISLPPLLAVTLALGIIGYNGDDLDLSDGHRIAVYADFPLLLHYNFGAGARYASPDKVGFYVGGGFTHTFTSYTNTFDKAAQTDFWAWVADGGIRLRRNYGGAFSIGLGIEQPLRTPIGPIHNPLFYQLNLTWTPKP
jgi:hypothetical protein